MRLNRFFIVPCVVAFGGFFSLGIIGRPFTLASQTSAEVPASVDDDERAEDPEDDAELGELAELRRELKWSLEELAEEKDELEADGDRLWAEHAAQQLKRSEQLLQLVERSIRLLRDLRQAEGRNETDKAEAIERQLEANFVRLERTNELIELREMLSELKVLSQELSDDASPKEKTQLEALVADQSRVIAMLTELHHLEDNDEDEESIEELGMQFDQLRETTELRVVVMHLERELRTAREEGETGHAAELADELQEVRAELASLAKLNQMINEPEPTRSPATPLVDLDAVELDSLVFERDVLPIMQAHCFDCHGDETQEGDLNIEQLLKVRPWVQHRETWNNIVQHTKAGVMPPQDSRPPNVEQRSIMVAWVNREIEEFDYTTISEPGFVPARRLSHEEYNRTISDLFEMQLRPADKFPAEASVASAFENSANTLFLQPLLVERYFAAAEEVLDQAMPADSLASPALKRMWDASSKDGDGNSQRVRRFLTMFMMKAFRRPTRDKEVNRFADHYTSLRSSGESHEDALRQTLAVVLLSPHFLMRIESPSEVGKDQAVSDWELASRLSYFLWSSMPDDRLFELAANGQLSDEKVLAAEVDRMLVDPKADSLGTVFAAQWLGFQHVGTRVRLDPIDNPWCTDSLMEAMRAETAMFFVALIRENRPLPDLIESDWTFLNEELARHYRIEGVRGPEMRKHSVDLDRRGGIFGHASLLAVTSFPDRTSPVSRGKWLLDNVLGKAPPPPPPNVSEFDEAIEENGRLTTRRKLEIHRRNPNCAVCHDQIDPLGLCLENYDHFGRYRRRDEGGQVDARGRLPDGTEFAGLAGLRQVIIERRLDELSEQLSRKLLTYALGRKLEYYDEATVQKLANEWKQQDYRMNSLIHGIVTSYPFRYKRLRDENERSDNVRNDNVRSDNVRNDNVRSDNVRSDNVRNDDKP